MMPRSYASTLDLASRGARQPHTRRAVSQRTPDGQEPVAFSPAVSQIVTALRIEMDLHGRVAWITGASRGIGAAIARRLAREGLKTVLVGRARAELDAVAREIGGVVRTVDVTDTHALEALVTEVERTVGPIDVLVNNAGVAESAPLGRVTDEQWSQTFAINVTATFVLCRAVMPGMAKRGWGRVINIASNAGLTGYAYTSAYCASKHAVVGLTRALAVEFARTGVTVNAVCPGFVDTEMSDRAIARIVETTHRTADEARKSLESVSPQRRLMTVDEVSHAVAALLPHEARGIHGQMIVIDGGQVME